jgi:hypothetical protein
LVVDLSVDCARARFPTGRTPGIRARRILRRTLQNCAPRFKGFVLSDSRARLARGSGNLRDASLRRMKFMQTKSFDFFVRAIHRAMPLSPHSDSFSPRPVSMPARLALRSFSREALRCWASRQREWLH